MRAYLHHIDTIKNAKRPLDLPKTSFLCGLSHCIKLMVKDVFVLALQSKQKINVEKINTMQFKKYCRCWICKSHILHFKQFKKLSKALVEALSGYHKWCDLHWCYAAALNTAEESITKYLTVTTVKNLTSTVAISSHPVTTAITDNTWRNSHVKSSCSLPFTHNCRQK